MYLNCAGSTASTGSGSGAEYSSSGDEILLENYFTNLAAFRFDHAREICVSSNYALHL